MIKQHPHTNRLINEKSPYLQQHAHNPVDWYPWGEEALEAARIQDKPIFLSIGYATCHWCHVMERESFENIEVAKLMNEYFINIKVDREERPDLDSLYIEFAQSMMSGAAGWPLNLLLTPDLRPFFAATYLPTHSTQQLIGLCELIERIHEVWDGDEREDLIEQSKRIVETFRTHTHVRGDEIPEKELVDDVAEALFKKSDHVYGGMQGVQKFPVGYQWTFLLGYANMTHEGRSLFLAERTLDMMQRGGIYDHLGGGFSRYSVDERWLVPHFEKMLYDNALLAHTYLQAWKMTQRPMYRTICKEILGYVLRDMTHPEGGFYSAEDADSEGHEGLFYTWTYDEICQVLGEDESLHFRQFYQITPEGNFEERNILNTPDLLETYAHRHHLNLEDLERELNQQKERLWRVREERVHPFKDEKILSSWNGLMIYSMAEAGATLNEKRFIEAAKRAAQFIKAMMYRDGILLRRWKDGEAKFTGGLDEYAFLIRGLISLFEVGKGTEWLEWAIELTQKLHDQFKAESGAFYHTDGQDPHVILRKCQLPDSAEPSGNAIHCENLLRLYQITREDGYLEQAEDVLGAVKEFSEHYPLGYCYHALNLMRYYDKNGAAVVVALNKQKAHQNEIRELFYSEFHPHSSIVWRHEGDDQICHLIKDLDKQIPLNNKTTLYVCHEGVCLEPITDFMAMKEILLGMS